MNYAGESGTALSVAANNGSPSNAKKDCPGVVRQAINLTVLATFSGGQLAAAMALARTTGLTVGYGVGGSGGVSYSILKNFRFAGEGSVHVVVDPKGNIGLAVSFGGGPGYGSGVVAGGQWMVSRAGTIWDLRGPSVAFAAGGGSTYGGGAELSSNAGGTLTISGGFAWGGFGAALNLGPTKVVPLVCK